MIENYPDDFPYLNCGEVMYTAPVAKFEIAWGANVEWYSMEKDTFAADYESEIWIPVKRK